MIHSSLQYFSRRISAGSTLREPCGFYSDARRRSLQSSAATHSHYRQKHQAGRLLESNSSERSAKSLLPFSTYSANGDLSNILQDVQNGTLSIVDAERRLSNRINQGDVSAKKSTPEEILESYANLDHTRAKRSGFPEVVFGEGKTSQQIVSILDDMARHINEKQSSSDIESSSRSISTKVGNAILATRYGD